MLLPVRFVQCCNVKQNPTQAVVFMESPILEHRRPLFNLVCPTIPLNFWQLQPHVRPIIYLIKSPVCLEEKGRWWMIGSYPISWRSKHEQFDCWRSFKDPLDVWRWRSRDDLIGISCTVCWSDLMEEENSDQFSSDSNVSVLLGFTPVSTVYILVDLDVVVVDFQLLLLRQR